MRILLLAFALGAVLALPARALEPLRLYDKFSDKTIDPARWSDSEKVRVIHGGKMQLMQRSYGLGTADAGVLPTNWHSNLANPQAISALKARILVESIETNACPSNPAVGEARARIIGSFYNVATPTPGSQLNDAIAQIRVYRFSNSSDPAGLLRVQGFLYTCTSADCNSSAIVGNVVDLGTVMVGKPVTVQIQWDKPGKTFYFSREGGPTGTVAYPESDAAPPSLPFKQVSTRVIAPNCQAAPRVSGMVDARFDNVSVNATAAP